MSPAAAVPRLPATGDSRSPSGLHVTLDTTRAHDPGRPALVHAVAGTVLAAGLYAVACPPHQWWLAAWAAPALLLLSTRRLGVGRAAICGVLFGVALGCGVVPWLVHASLDYFALDRVRAIAFVVVVWAVVVGGPFACLLSAHAALARRVPRWLGPAVGAWLWAGMEIVRTVVGMPWALLGHTQVHNLRLIQIADLGGVYAVSFVMAFVSLAVVEAVVAGHERRPRAAAGMLAGAVGVLAATLVYGALAMRVHATDPDGARTRTIAVVQGNVRGEFRWKRVYYQRTVATYAQLSSAAARDGVDLIVWPENAVNFYLEHEPMLQAQVAPIARLTRDGLILGAPRLADAGVAHNSAYLLSPDGGVAATYDKQQLVPLAEHDPFRSARPANPDALAYEPGGSGGVLAAGRTTLGAAICYEVLFPRLVRDRVRDGAELLVNIANDAWLDPGDGMALRQHFSMAVFAAVETRRYLVRAANTGISGFVAPTGAVYATLPIGQAGSSIGRVVLRDELTPYVRFGDAWLVVVGLALAATVWKART